MTFLGILLFIVQAAFAVHVIRTGRETYWIFIIMGIPALGCAVYFFTQVLPDSRNSYTVRKTGNQLLKAIDPERELRARKDELEIVDTVENRLKLADEYIEAGQYDDAIPLLKKSLDTTHEDDPYMLEKMAQALFGKEDYQETINTLELLIEKNPHFQSHDGHLIYARSLEALDKTDEALEEYKALATSYPGEEGRVRYAQLLITKNQPDAAQQVFQDVLARTKRAPKYYVKKEKQWIAIAKQGLK
uniref:Uncharacterized protein n=1 Tax=uncultured Thiotrichaceae bacterium TaxID=298394 RepID=A0A6S6TZ01_9GAMM|nr:MAG: Unknown protein [uncultured Thiotrichaceae bacterium]